MYDSVSLLMFGVVIGLGGIFFWSNPRKELLTASPSHPGIELAWCLFPGLLLTLLGGQIAFGWPLVSSPLGDGQWSGNPNIVIGRPSLFFGLLLILAWLVSLLSPTEPRNILWKPLCQLAVVGGVLLLALSLAILVAHVGQPPASDPAPVRAVANSLVWAIIYACCGLAACVSPFALTRPRVLVLIRGLLFPPLVAFGFFAILTTIAHVQGLPVLP